MTARKRETTRADIDDRPTGSVVASWSDERQILDERVVVPRESKLLARKTVADQARGAGDCRELLEALGIYDLDTLPE